MAARTPIPQKIQSRILLANRHACCVCQKGGVQIHHIDGNPANNNLENLAALCLDHHDRATMTVGLTKKLKPDQVHNYKETWERRCANDIMALSRSRFTFYYCVYKNPQRIREILMQLDATRRTAACRRIVERLAIEQPIKDDADSWLGGGNANPKTDSWTNASLASIAQGENYPGYLGQYEPHPADPDYSRDCSTQEAMSAYHLYDLWCQVAGQVLSEAHGAMPLEDLYAYNNEDEFDAFSGELVSFKLSVWGKDIHIPAYWRDHPTGRLTARKKVNGKIYRVRMTLRTMYLFSDTAAVNLERARISGLGVFNGATEDDDGNIEITVTPLLIGYGGWNLYPEGFPAPHGERFREVLEQEEDLNPPSLSNIY